MIDISVILIAQNKKNNIEKTLESILNQTIQKLEIICINTLSDDATLKTLNAYQKYDNRINIINTTPTDLELSIDNTIKTLNGKYVSFINDGDYISEDFYEKMYATALNNSSHIIECNNLYTNNAIKQETLLNKIFPNSLLQKNYKKSISGFKTFEISLLKQILFFNPRIINIDDGVCFKNSDNISLSQKDDSLIISLTSYPARIKIVHKTIETLLNQSLKADKIILWLAENQFPNKEQDLPHKLLSQTHIGLTICWYHKDIKSYKKLIPTLIQYPNSVIVTADDDVYYDKKWLETLYLPHITNNTQTIYSHRAHQILFDNNNQIKPYTEWNLNINSTNSSHNLLFTGVGGVLYPPHSLHIDTINEDLFMKLCPHGDDLWFWAMATLNNTKIQTINIYNTKLKTVHGSQSDALCYDNVKNGRNDSQLKNILNHYPEIYQKLDYNMPILEKKRKYKTLNVLGIKIKIKTGIKPLKIIRNCLFKIS